MIDLDLLIEKFAEGGKLVPYAKSGIHIKKSHRGLFTAKAKRAGMGILEYARKVVAKNSGASTATKRQAQFAINSKRFKH